MKETDMSWVGDHKIDIALSSSRMESCETAYRVYILLRFFLAYAFLSSGISAPGYASATMTTSPSDLFGTHAVPLAHTPLDDQWLAVRERPLPANNAAVAALISENRGAARRTQIVAVNAWVNERIVYASDREVYGRADHWVALEEALREGRGDCEEYAIAKYQLLTELGWGEDDIFIVIGRDKSRRVDHALLAVKIEGMFFILDCVSTQISRDRDFLDFLPVISLNRSRAWLHGLAMNDCTAFDGREGAREEVQNWTTPPRDRSVCRSLHFGSGQEAESRSAASVSGLSQSSGR